MQTNANKSKQIQTNPNKSKQIQTNPNKSFKQWSLESKAKSHQTYAKV
jgi:hypothetical protein